MQRCDTVNFSNSKKVGKKQSKSQIVIFIARLYADIKVFLQCFIVSTVNALRTPMINAGMVSYLFISWQLLSYYLISLIHRLCQVLCDRHFGGINYPVGGVGGIAVSLAEGLIDQGSEILYKANVTNIILDQGKAVSLFIDLKCLA